jgi:hypothetical protein
MRYQPSVAKVAGNKGFRAVVQVRDHAGKLLCSRVSPMVFATKEAARNFARGQPDTQSLEWVMPSAVIV